MFEEITTIEKNQAWTLVKPSQDDKTLGVKCVYRVKKNHLGEFMKSKSRLLVKGYSQKFGVDHVELFNQWLALN